MGKGIHGNAARIFDQEEEVEANEQEVDQLVEEFRQRLESCFKNQTNPPKRKMKPNISVDWITQLRQRLKSGSTQENSSNERYEKSPAKQQQPAPTPVAANSANGPQSKTGGNANQNRTSYGRRGKNSSAGNK